MAVCSDWFGVSRLQVFASKTKQCAARRVGITGSLPVEVTGRLVTRLYTAITWTSAATG